MLKVLATLAIFLLASPAFANGVLTPSSPPIQTTQQRLEAIIGNLVVQNAELGTRVDMLTKQMSDIAKKQVKPEETPSK